MGTIKISGNAIRYTLIPELMIKDHLSAAPGDFVKVLLAVYYLHQFRVRLIHRSCLTYLRASGGLRDGGL